MTATASRKAFLETSNLATWSVIDVKWYLENKTTVAHRDRVPFILSSLMVE